MLYKAPLPPTSLSPGGHSIAYSNKQPTATDSLRQTAPQPSSCPHLWVVQGQARVQVVQLVGAGQDEVPHVSLSARPRLHNAHVMPAGRGRGLKEADGAIQTFLI